MRALLVVLIGLPSVLSEGDLICEDGVKHWSGELNAGGDVDYFYYFASSRSATPEDMGPLVLWMTGGPGCSSTLALLLENGPCTVKRPIQGGSGDFEVSRNPWSWNQVANVLWVDQPLGVGYSTPGTDLVQNERGVADRMLLFLFNFYDKFPKFRKAPLFVTGESYGGHYIPAVASRIHQWQHRPSDESGIGPLIGIAIGNGLVDAIKQFKSKAEMAYTGGKGGSLGGKGVIDKPTYESMKQYWPACEEGIIACRAVGHTEDVCMNAMQKCMMTQIVPVANMGRDMYDLRKPCPNPPMCLDFSAQLDFLNEASVKKRLGVPASRQWEACNVTSMLPFILSGDEFAYYHKKVGALLDAGIKVLIYNGDTDAMVDWIGTKAWLQELQWNHREEWLAASNDPYVQSNGETVGMKQTSNGLTFIQVYHSGHMVPMDQPAVALEMIQDFLKQSMEPSASWPFIFETSLSLIRLPATLFATAAAVALLLFLGVVVGKRQSCDRHLEENYQLLA